MSATRTAPSATPADEPALTAAAPKPATAKTVAAKPAKAPAAKAAAKPAATKAPIKRTANATAAPDAKDGKDAKTKKPKLVRDSFTIPKDEYAVIEELKQRTSKLTQTAKKSELLRAGLKLLASLNEDALLKALHAVPSIKTGRPKTQEKPAASKPVKATRK